MTTRLRWIGFVAAVALLGCDADTDDESESAEVDVSAELSAAALDAAEAATFRVRAIGCGPNPALGMASLVDTELAITAAHVVAGADEVLMVDSDGDEHDADVVWFDPALDLAVLRAPTVTAHPVATGRSAVEGDPGILLLPRTEEESTTVERLDVTVTRTVNIETTDIYLDIAATRPGFEVDAEIEPGDSGSMVLFADARGGAVGGGMIWARSTERDGRAWAIDLPELVTDPAQLDELRIPVDNGTCVP